MGKIVYSSIMNRWLYGRDIDKNSGAVFKEGYDDPTYMTFKIEFGDWGASILERYLITQGTTVFSPNSNDYDALPIGLLNCPDYGDINNAYWQNNAKDDHLVFNNTKLYSAFSYLRSRNEDTRARYLYYFVNGLYEIQLKTPFIFKKITGLNALESFNPTDGQRLKTPARITIECYESLNLKIRTLMEFYRKAAWDDVYQRWVLPENMRQFKMIIYVFERRIFQSVQRLSPDVKEGIISYSDLNGDIPVKAYECCPCEFNIGESQSWENDLSSDWSGAEASSKLVIEVKNVKTYFKNGLLHDTLYKSYKNNGKSNNDDNNLNTKLDSFMIYDLVENLEKRDLDTINEELNSTGNISNMTVNGVKSLFLNKTTLLEKEEADPKIKSYIWGLSNVNFDSDDINNTVKSEISEKLYQLYSPKDNDYYLPFLQGQLESLADYFMIEDNSYYRGGWLYTLATGPTYDQNKSFWNNLGDNVMNILTGSRRLILMSGAANITLYNNCLIDSFYWPPIPYEPYDPLYNNNLGKMRIIHNSMDSITRKVLNLNYEEFSESSEIKPTDSQFSGPHYINSPETIYNNSARKYYTADNKIDTPEDQISSIPWIQNLNNTQLNGLYKLIEENEKNGISKDETLRRYLILNNGLYDDNLSTNMTLLNGPIDVDDNDNINIMSFNPEDRQMDKQQFSEINDPMPFHEQLFNELNDARIIPDLEFGELSSRTVKDQEFAPLEEPRDNIDLQYKPLAEPREKDEQQFGNLEKARNIDKQQYTELEKARNIDKQQYTNLEETRNIDKQQYVEILNPKDKSKQKYRELEPGREQPEQTYNTINKPRKTNNDIEELVLIARQLPGFKNISMEDVRKLPKQDLLDLKDATERSVPSFKVNRSVLMENINNVEGSNMKLLELDKDNKIIEDNVIEALNSNKLLSNFTLLDTNNSDDEKTTKMRGIMNFTKIFTDNSEKIKKAYVSSILDMKSNLREITNKVINSLPEHDTYIIKKGEVDNNDNMALISINDMEQINKNMGFLSINDADVPKLSFLTLISIHNDLSESIQRTMAIVGLTEITYNSVATTPNAQQRKKLSKSVIQDTPKPKPEVIY